MQNKNINATTGQKETVKKKWLEPTITVASKDIILSSKGVFLKEVGTDRSPS